ncbi:MAG TPA: methyltransferase domain-containing protein [Candidatus Binatia bacterium]|nr:methyltransferase domain-containing protein [Candidatus Binatia bacterium]
MPKIAPQDEKYTHGHAPATIRQHAQRTAEEAAAFVLPELRPGMRVLDVGCGPGSITRGLARYVAPGQVIGLDASADVLESARTDAGDAANLRYEQGSVYALPFDDASFDVVYAHQVLQHLAEPSRALAEMLRGLRVGGWIAVRDVDWGTVAYWPIDPWIDRFIAMHLRTWRRNGGDPWMGRRLRSLFSCAGVGELRISASTWCYATPQETIAWGDAYADRLLTSPMGARAVEYGFASQEDLEAMADALRSWARKGDAFWTFVHVAALGVRKRGQAPFSHAGKGA